MPRGSDAACAGKQGFHLGTFALTPLLPRGGTIQAGLRISRAQRFGARLHFTKRVTCFLEVKRLTGKTPRRVRTTSRFTMRVSGASPRTLTPDNWWHKRNHEPYTAPTQTTSRTFTAASAASTTALSLSPYLFVLLL